ncbi:type I phosphomannose isomerase catalytic subunit [Neorhodopirellula lusitana]|uniref:type I phosphomannose isomerase catalytic subunit n=1 Tax=Neorhodopirellula lusitana TaxID=445327 RepID=UPI00385176E6
MKPYPLQFAPLIKQTIWGGRRLGTHLNKPIGDADDYAESWEIVDHGDDQSVVTNGDLKGQTLNSLFLESREWLLGKQWIANNPDAGSFPLLLKFLDCNRVLSVQVHPDDEYGATMTPPDLGKTEAWVILATTPDSVIYAGLKPGVTPESLREMVADGRTEEALHSFHPKPGDCVFIPAGTVHALGGGLLVAEIQQSSNTTFRLFDWNRLDANGNSRELHIEQSLEVTDFERGPVDPVVAEAESGITRLVSCNKFDLNSIRDTTTEIANTDRCQLITVVEGTAEIQHDDTVMQLNSGESVLIPAKMSQFSINAPSGHVLQMSPAINDN